ncbi:hypothetical protein LPJ78_000373 [Coemansia sp. RSA 989]|nr:gamma-glutamyltranspeptidase [Coemansia mojavensis]KAJ1743640.1 hypothetical protein LPJ68_000804 [Coemansia sp. RSA 1086]KAJ1752356.1 hypothetical protein LPJ79_001319 [Coemansia sp. RSA 1821]KAJ1868244.1 hypothetical protein LPJ78_000373 [Coemansia sp. RSA 989]KAJ1874751.1 hypothetical protein LPJ55_001224 [Coemansia sp. RSA 990]KAJ2677331.1 hypothetical protein IWW42_000137 [Coemansia sp. RSA 1085]
MAAKPTVSPNESQNGFLEALLPSNDGYLPVADTGTTADSSTSRSRCKRITYICLIALLAAAFIGGVFAIASSHSNAGTQSTLVKARKGAVATDEPRCSVVGTDILRAGGNAVDAAVASTLCIGVLQAHSSGIGGGGFMLVHPGHGARPVLFDFREAAGQAATSDMFINNITKASVGPLASGVPGEIAGLYHAHKRFGKLAWHRLFEPAIALAKNGAALNSVVHGQLVRFEQEFRNSPGFNTTYFNSQGELLKVGEPVYRPELAKTLSEVAHNGPDSFYKGYIAKSLVKTIQDQGGILTTDDFARYTVVEREPIETYYHGRRVITGSAPTSGSILLNMLNVVEGFTLALDGPTALNYHRLVEAMKFGAAQRTLLGDPSFVDIMSNLTRQISKGFASEIRANISDTQTFDVDHYDPEYDVLNNHGTTHLSILDKDEMAVALTSTVNLEFGSRIMDPSTGIILNDEMDDFSTTNETNSFGLRPSPNNKIVPKKRPMSSTSATIIEHNGHVELVAGGSGGSRILTAVLQVIVNVLDFGMRLDEAIDYPRLHHQLLPHQLSIDPLFPNCIAHQLAALGHAIAPLRRASSTVQAVHRLSDGIIHAVSDARKHGVAAGY